MRLEDIQMSVNDRDVEGKRERGRGHSAVLFGAEEQADPILL